MLDKKHLSIKVDYKQVEWYFKLD